jgi:hypothetical protein
MTNYNNALYEKAECRIIAPHDKCKHPNVQSKVGGDNQVTECNINKAGVLTLTLHN